MRGRLDSEKRVSARSIKHAPEPGRGNEASTDRVMVEAMASPRRVGDLLREWRQRRRISQLDLANQADISARHLSFLETGRSQPSREMLLHLAGQLQVPLRERNILFKAAGFAPAFSERHMAGPAPEVILKPNDVVV